MSPATHAGGELDKSRSADMEVGVVGVSSAV